jgi:hypothetical protein
MALSRSAPGFALFVLAACLSARDASAQDVPLTGPPPGWYLPVGINAGFAVLAKSSPGAVVGAEASVVHLGDQESWLGAYVDAAYITNENATRFSAGPEIGFFIFGLDGGFLDVIDHGRDLAGFTLRPMLTLGVVAIYARWDHTFSRDDREDGAQIGILLKLPIALSGQKLF